MDIQFIEDVIARARRSLLRPDRLSSEDFKKLYDQVDQAIRMIEDADKDKDPNATGPHR